jgi:carbamoylphosphate synthase large subunit
LAGYKDSGADIAYNLHACQDVEVVLPSANPDPTKDDHWCFPDNEDGILQAIDMGATHLWANTILFSSHPLQTSQRIGDHQDKIRVVGQGPKVVEKYDNKDYVNSLVRNLGGFTMPAAWPASADTSVSSFGNFRFPVVVKPIRGRGSYGVKVCRGMDEFKSHVEKLRAENLSIMIEQFLAGEEATVTVMPPTADKGYWALPIVTRFNHMDGIAPYNGVVAVTANSRAVTGSDDPAYAHVASECEQVARVLGVTAPIRIDVRRFDDSVGSKFAIFDVNMKPVSY